MLKKTLIMLSLPLMLSAYTIPELFDALKRHSQTKSDEMVVKKAEIYEDLADAKLYPKINLFASYDHYSSPTNLLPVPPNTIKNPATAQPFSQNITREGAAFTMPIFMKSIFTLVEKAKIMQKSAKAKKYINLLENEALIVGNNANYIYLVALQKSLDIKEKSLLETKKTLQIKVENGRVGASELYKINDSLNQINITKNSIEIQKRKLISIIYSLTGIKLEAPVTMSVNENLDSSRGLASLEPLRVRIAADKLSVKAEKEKLYPAFFAQGTYVFSQGTAYNNDKSLNEEYGNIGVILNIPLLQMENYSEISLAKIEVKSSEVELAKMTDELESKAQMLEESLPLLYNSVKLYTQSIDDKKQLLELAKLNFKNGRLSTEEYLRYEDDVISAEAQLYKADAEVIQTKMQLAVIYANNIEEMLK
ncbi:TolC family protein [Sulfurimonas sp.]|jgi:outer membrane protein TolC|uniref:TolC family protein n=1 Tax=Sulfurimonas sp. TaxID=2022749 RepID=UPI0025E01CE4|nr:TolC family protein [Sulfurimonas sp.]MCK9473755.1 TolC family protein [Sulfurimonas sp.]MDD3505088.1 TolC family protein [Sulfurimonas sp.]